MLLSPSPPPSYSKYGDIISMMTAMITFVGISDGSISGTFLAFFELEHIRVREPMLHSKKIT